MGVAEYPEDKITARRMKHGFHFKTGRFKLPSRGKPPRLDGHGLW